jgi:hypothetical protein
MRLMNLTLALLLRLSAMYARSALLSVTTNGSTAIESGLGAIQLEELLKTKPV